MIDIQEAVETFRGVAAVDKLRLHVEKGEILGLLGANGAGKSTTINMLLGFLKPDSGTVSINGLNVFQNAREVSLRSCRVKALLFACYAKSS